MITAIYHLIVGTWVCVGFVAAFVLSYQNIMPNSPHSLGVSMRSYCISMFVDVTAHVLKLRPFMLASLC